MSRKKVIQDKIDALNELATTAAVYLMKSNYFKGERDVFTREFHVMAAEEKGLVIEILITRFDATVFKDLVCVPWKVFK